MTLEHMRRKSGNIERKTNDGTRCRTNNHLGSSVPWEDAGQGRNRRTVWTIATRPFKGAHFATFPEKLIEPCIPAGCPEGGTVLDPFFGAGTTGVTAKRLNRNCVGIELNREYCEIARKRLNDKMPLFAEEVSA